MLYLYRNHSTNSSGALSYSWKYSLALGVTGIVLDTLKMLDPYSYQFSDLETEAQRGKALLTRVCTGKEAGSVHSLYYEVGSTIRLPPCSLSNAPKSTVQGNWPPKCIKSRDAVWIPACFMQWSTLSPREGTGIQGRQGFSYKTCSLVRKNKPDKLFKL